MVSTYTCTCIKQGQSFYYYFNNECFALRFIISIRYSTFYKEEIVKNGSAIRPVGGRSRKVVNGPRPINKE